MKPLPLTDGLPLPRRYGAILAIALGITVAVLDGAIANVALPTIAQDLNTTPAQSVWIINGYQMAVVVSLLSLSALGDKVGYRRIYQCGLVLFGCTSLLCALSGSLEMLTFARILQGFGGAAIMSVNTALISIIYPRHFLGRGMAINSLIVAVSTAAGPTVAAAILAVTHWQWLFLINIPVSCAALCLAWHYLPYNPHKTAHLRLDMPSVIMNAITFGLLISTLNGIAQKHSVSSVLAETAGFLVVGFLFIRRQLRLPLPLLPVDLLRIPIFSLSVGTSICSFCAQMLAMVSLPFFLQSELERTEVEAGLLLTPWPLATIVMAPIAGRLIERYHAGLLGGIGLALFATGLFALAMLPASPTDADIIWRMVFCGAGFGLFQSPNNHTIIVTAPRNRSGGASGMLGTARLLGQSSGAALVALMFNRFATQGTHASLILAGYFSAAAALISLTRITQRPTEGK